MFPATRLGEPLYAELTVLYAEPASGSTAVAFMERGQRRTSSGGRHIAA
jgi:hypothetical protein